MKHMILAFMFVTASAVMVGAQPPLETEEYDAFDCPRFLAQAEDDSAWEAGDMPLPGMPDRPRFGHGPKRFERLRMNKLVEFLGLEGEDRAAFVSVSEKYRDRRMELDLSHKATLDSLARGLRTGDLNEQDVYRLTEKLDNLEAKRQGARREFREEIKPLLKPDQYGKLVVFEYRFEAQILGRLNEFRRQGGPPFDQPGRHHQRPDDLDDDSI